MSILKIVFKITNMVLVLIFWFGRDFIHLRSSLMRTLIIFTFIIIQYIPQIMELKGVLNAYKSVTGILPNNLTMLQQLSVFMNFHP